MHATGAGFKLSVARLCGEFGISRPTGYKIYNRYKDLGYRGLPDKKMEVAREGIEGPAYLAEYKGIFANPDKVTLKLDR